MDDFIRQWKHLLHVPLLLLIPIISSLLVFVMLCGGVTVASMVSNNIRTKRFMNRLFDYPLPSQTEVVYRQAFYFRPLNGGTCVFQVSEALVTSLPREEVENHYKGVSFPPLRRRTGSDQTRRVDVKPLFINGPREDGRQLYRLSISEAFFNGGFDPRCEPGATEGSPYFWVLLEGTNPFD
jgi:hypothetical protein